ncbi:MAG: hypothetical protein QXI84_06295 [Thermofilaceae archaeon]
MSFRLTQRLRREGVPAERVSAFIERVKPVLRPSVEKENVRISMRGEEGRELLSARRRFCAPPCWRGSRFPREMVERSPGGVRVDVE